MQVEFTKTKVISESWQFLTLLLLIVIWKHPTQTHTKNGAYRLKKVYS